MIVYSAAEISDDLCDLADATPLATGRAHMTGTDNDVFASLKRTNSYGTNLVGTASGPSGDFKVRGSFRTTIDRNGNADVRHLKVSITPLGG